MNVNNEASFERRYGRVRRGTLQPGQDDNPSTLYENEALQNPAPSVSSANQPTTTKAGKPRQRIQWTDEMNTNVMRCFYITTKLGKVKTGYRDEFLKNFLDIYPQMSGSVTTQRLADQKRHIIEKEKLTQIEIENIKHEAAILIGETSPQQDTIQNNHTIPETPLLPSQNDDAQETTNDYEQHHISHQEIPENATSTELIIKHKLLANITKWKNITATNRNTLPRLNIRKNTYSLIDITNTHILPEICNNVRTLEHLHLIVYATATTILQLNGQEIHENILTHNRKKPKWQVRIENKINSLRKDIGRLTQYDKGNRSKRILKHVKQIMEKEPRTITEAIDTHKQKLSAYAARLRRYNETRQRRIENNTFYKSQKKFYRQLTPHDEPNTPKPTKQEITNYWKNIWSLPSEHNKNSNWIKTEKDHFSSITPQQNYKITVNELTEIIKRTHNWKSPGSDKITNFWYKKLTSVHSKLVDIFNNILDEPDNIPHFLTEGITYVKPKSTNTSDPANYRPITCLPTIYKILTATISEKIYNHLLQYNILTNEQKGCRKGSMGCKEQLIIDEAVMQQAYQQNRNLHTCYIDYKKAFDMIPHTWLIEIMEIYKIHPNIVTFLRKCMQQWKTKINLSTNTETIETELLNIQRGIFQGDSLSALWFCMVINPLSRMLKTTKYGFKIQHNKATIHKINHLLYMDDIKLYAATKDELNRLLKITSKFTADIRMEFGLSKCKSQHIEKGKWTQSEPMTIGSELLDNLEQNETYKYLGFHQSNKLDHTKIKQELKQQYVKRLKNLLKSYLNSNNLFKAINTYAISTLTYSFGIIKWTPTDLNNLEITTRKLMSTYRKHHPKSCIERMTLPRSEGGRGLIDIHNLHNRQKQTLINYFRSHTQLLQRAIAQIDNNYTPLNLANTTENINNVSDADKLLSWSQKEIHGKHIRIIRERHIDRQRSYTWLMKGTLQPETEGFAIAIQDGVINTRNYRKHILKDHTIISDMCRKCRVASETLDHILSGCQLLAGTHYTERHNAVAKLIHQQIINTYEIETTNEPYYKYIPQPIHENEKFKIYWDRAIITDRTIINNRPDITIVNKENKTTTLVEISVPNDNNINKKYSEKLAKYEQLAIEIKNIWRQDHVKIVPLIISTTGILHKEFIEGLKSISVKEDLHHQIQKAVILKTCNIVRTFINTT